MKFIRQDVPGKLSAESCVKLLLLQQAKSAMAPGYVLPRLWGMPQAREEKRVRCNATASSQPRIWACLAMQRGCSACF